MKNAGYSSIRIRLRALACIGLLGFGLIAISNGQNSGKTDFIIRVGVEEVRLDAVVLDRKGRQITDLTVDDFEIRQNGTIQKITSATYISEYQAQPKVPSGAAQNSKLPPPIPIPMLTQKDVRRTFVFVVDNIMMDFTQIYDARKALRKFVETQMQPGDLVVIVPTAGGNTEFQTFTSDKQHMLSIINNLQWIGVPGYRYDPMLQLTAIAYCIKVLQDMPGRKSLILLSGSVWINTVGIDPYEAERLRVLYNKLADAALHAGVVIHTLDIAQLAGPWSNQELEDFGAEKGSSIYRLQTSSNSTSNPIPLSEKTGGLFVTDSNFSSSPSGIGRASEMIKGYYLLTYIPPADTFNKNAIDPYAHIKMKVKRRGCEVHTRDGFSRVPASSNASLEKVNSLHEAIFSPFRYNDLNVDLVSGYIDDPQKGYLLQSWVHVDAKDLGIVEAKEGMHSISLEAACITSNIDNVILDSSSQRYDYSFKSADIPWVKEHGLRFSLTLPVKKPGSYYVRAAMKELGSGKIGSAYQFIEVPDLKKGRLSLSNIFIINRGDDMPWSRTQHSELSPDVRLDPRQSSALRSYRPGENFDYAAMIYNAKTGATQKPDLESQFTLFGNGKELFKSVIAAVDLIGVSDFRRIPIRKTLVLEKSIEPGDYVLLLQITDKQANKKNSLAAQALHFKVLAP